MKIIKFDEDQHQQWMDARRGKITGTTLEDITPLARPKKEPFGDKREGWWNKLAEKISITSDIDEPNEQAMNRGNRLEPDAIDAFIKETGSEVIKDKVIWVRDDNEDIALSPDGYSKDLTEAVEVKCLGSGKHVKAMVLNQRPTDYEFQIIQYFITNEKLKTLYFVMYDPTLLVKNLLIFPITREEIAEKATDLLEIERKQLEEMDDIVADLMKGEK